MSPTRTASTAFETARRRRADVVAALGELEAALTAPARNREPEWSARLAAATGRLIEAWDAHVTVTEGAAGLFDEVIDVAPRLSHDVDVLKGEHVAIRGLLDDVAALVNAADPATVDAQRQSAMEVMASIVRHRHRGSDLVYDAYCLDIAAAD